jgi:hypothetical protein
VTSLAALVRILADEAPSRSRPASKHDTWQLRNGERVFIDDLPGSMVGHIIRLVDRATVERRIIHPAAPGLYARLRSRR